MASTTTMSGAAFDQLPLEEGRHLELLEGEVITVATAIPEHQMIVLLLGASLLNHFRRDARGGVLPDSEFALGEDTRVCPDLAVLLGERWVSLDRKKTPIPVAPDIAIEVISPSERATDSQRKVWVYLGAGVQEVWQVWSDTLKVFVYQGAKSVTILEVGDRLSTPLLPNWDLPLREIFSA